MPVQSNSNMLYHAKSGMYAAYAHEPRQGGKADSNSAPSSTRISVRCTRSHLVARAHRSCLPIGFGYHWHWQFCLTLLDKPLKRKIVKQCTQHSDDDWEICWFLAVAMWFVGADSSQTKRTSERKTKKCRASGKNRTALWLLLLVLLLLLLLLTLLLNWLRRNDATENKNPKHNKNQ